MAKDGNESVAAFPTAAPYPAMKFRLLGGMSWESTQPYYARINQHVQARLGAVPAELLLWSANC